MQRSELKKWARHLKIEAWGALFCACIINALTFGGIVPLVWATAAIFGVGALAFHGLYSVNKLWRCKYSRYFINPRYLVAGFAASVGFAIMAVLEAI